MKLQLSIDGIPLLEEELLAVAEAAKVIGKPKIWVYRRVKEGKIKTFPGLGTILIPKSGLLKLSPKDFPLMKRNETPVKLAEITTDSQNTDQGQGVSFKPSVEEIKEETKKTRDLEDKLYSKIKKDESLYETTEAK